MGYRSNTAYAIVFKSEEDKNRLLDKFPAHQREWLRSEESGLKELPDRLLFHENYIKWYSTRSMAGLMEGYKDVDTHEDLLEAAEAANNLIGEDRIPSVGVFARIGEEDDDIEHRIWGDPAMDGLPDWYELVDIQRSLAVGW